MNIHGIGTDIVNVNRIKLAIKKNKNFFKKKFILILKLKSVKRKKTKLSVTQNDLLPKRLFLRQLVLEINYNFKI